MNRNRKGNHYRIQELRCIEYFFYSGMEYIEMARFFSRVWSRRVLPGAIEGKAIKMGLIRCPKSRELK